MKKKSALFILTIALLAILFDCNTRKLLDLPHIFSDHMVLQRGIDIPVWGKATPGTTVNVQIADNKVQTKADENGKWMVKIPAMTAGGPYKMVIDNGKKTTFDDVLIGDVWFASGQSNMEFQVQSAKNSAQEISDAVSYPQIRLFTAPKTLANLPKEDLPDVKWLVCDSSSVKDFSAVAYFFGRMLNKDLNVPIGLINSSWGGTPAEAWTSKEKIITIPVFEKRVREFEGRKIPDSVFALDQKKDELRWKLASSSNVGFSQKVHTVEYSDKNWTDMKVPASIDQSAIGHFDGIVWFRKSFELQSNMAGKDLVLHLGRVDLKDKTYFNGTLIGESNFNGDAFRYYKIPGNLVKAGLNLIAVQDVDMWGPGGLTGPADSMFIADPKNKMVTRLTGLWKYNEKIEPVFPTAEGFSQNASLIFNAMVAPVIPFGIKGAIWYQGEANAGRAYQYRTLFPLMIRDWRERWQEGDFPFLYVQLANFIPGKATPSENDWAELREAQLMTLKLPNTGMAVTIDIGNVNDIHPTNKQDVGKRLALAAEKITYGKDIVHSGPIYESMKIEGNVLRIKFTSTGTGLMAIGNSKLKGFALAGKDKKFYWADAIIDGNEVILKSLKVKNPVAARYGWDSSPDCNLFNKEGLPASPFRTDGWPGITINNE